MNIQLTISEDYCPTWSLREAIREFIQNGRDATRTGCTFDVFYNSDSRTIKLRTIGSSLSHKSLLLGESTKRGRNDMLGEQGEGYKIASLVLARLGKGVKIRTGTEVWVPKLEFAPKFGAKVLSFEITGGRKDINEVAVEVSGVTEEEWTEVKRRFLFIDDSNLKIVETPVGSVIMDGVGDIFVDGIWVCREAKLRHGYNFRPADMRLDRDRRLVSSWDAQTLAARTWEALYLRATREYCSTVDEMLAANVPDVEHFRYDWCIGMETRKKVAEHFQEKFGEKSIAVRTESEARELHFHGRKAQVVHSEPLRAILEQQLGTVESIQAEMAKEVKSEHSTVDLDPKESKNLLMAVEFISKALKQSGGSLTQDISIVEFNSPSILGMRKDNRILLSRHTLASFKEALKTLVEEVAHEMGADGTHEHVERIHEIYAAGITVMASGVPL